VLFWGVGTEFKQLFTCAARHIDMNDNLVIGDSKRIKVSSTFTFVSPSIIIYFFLILLNSMPGRDTRFLSIRQRPYRLWVPTSMLSDGYRGSSPRE
jgi:hypothetical protein